jgi:hypothetical protein
MNCDGGDVKRVESATNAHLGDAPSLPRRASRHFAVPGTPISSGVRLTVNYSGKEYSDKNNRSVSLIACSAHCQFSAANRAAGWDFAGVAPRRCHSRS